MHAGARLPNLPRPEPRRRARPRPGEASGARPGQPTVPGRQRGMWGPKWGRHEHADDRGHAVKAATYRPDTDVEWVRGTAQGRPRRRGRVIVGVVVLGLVVAALVAIRTLDRSATANRVDNSSPTSLATVKRETLASRANVNGTLGYAGSYSVVNQAAGTLTALPAIGDVIRFGDVLYRVNGEPVVLLRGAAPAFRSLVRGMRGSDVQRLNANLVELGYVRRAQLDPTSDRFVWRTAWALRKLQARLGLDMTGTLPLGQAVLLPVAVRVTEVSATLGTPAQPGVSTLSATS